MKKVLFFLMASLFIAACGEKGSRFRLEGKFKNINQGEFYIYDLDQGRIDTIMLQNGEFTYSVDLRDTTVFSLMFPNYSELPIIATPGDHVKIKGDVSHLKETIISGTDDNDLLTELRMKTNEKMPPEVKEAMLAFIDKHPESPICPYLLRRYCLNGLDADYARAQALSQKMVEARPECVPVVQMHQRLLAMGIPQIGDTLTAFTALDTDSNTVSDSLLRNHANVIMVWTSWNYDSRNALHQVRKLQKRHGDSINVVSICLDAHQGEGEQTLKKDSIQWPNICDGMMWESPLVSLLAINFVPDNIVIDHQGRIVARSLNNDKLKEKLESLLAE